MSELHDQFKRELKSYKYYKKEIKRLRELVADIDEQMYSISSPAFDKPPAHSNSDHRIDMICRKDIIMRKVNAMQLIIDYVDDCLGELDEEESEILTSVYMDNVSVEKIARTHYMSERKAFRYINRTIEKAVAR